MIPAFVDWAWCEQRAAAVVLADSRWYWDRPGRDAYEEGHILGAVHVDLDGHLSGPRTPGSGRHPLPDSATFARSMGSVGIDGSRPVIAYDDAGGVIAARLVWMLRTLGLEAAVLSGGITTYYGPLEGGIRSPDPASFKEQAWPDDAIVTTEHVATGSWTLVDARPANRFRGEDPEVDASLGAVPEADARRGHIPGAVNVPCRSHLTHERTIADPARIRASFAAAGITDAGDVVSYCGAGVTACHNLLAMEHAGIGRGKLYPGSWSAWSSDQSLPAETH